MYASVHAITGLISAESDDKGLERERKERNAGNVENLPEWAKKGTRNICIHTHTHTYINEI